MKKLKIALKMPSCIIFQFLEGLIWIKIKFLVVHESLSTSHWRTPQESIILSFFEVVRTRTKFLSGQNIWYFTRKSSRASNTRHMYSSSYTLCVATLSWRYHCLCRQTHYPYYPFACPYLPFLSFLILPLLKLSAVISDQSRKSCERPQKTTILPGWSSRMSREQAVRAPKLGFEENNDAVLFRAKRVWFPSGRASTLRLAVLKWALICCHVRRS